MWLCCRDGYWILLPHFRLYWGVKYVCILMYVSHSTVIIQCVSEENRCAFSDNNIRCAQSPHPPPPIPPSFISLSYLCLSGGGRRRWGGSELRWRSQFPLGEGEMVVHRSQQVWGKHQPPPLTPLDLFPYTRVDKTQSIKTEDGLLLRGIIDEKKVMCFF